MLGDLVGGGAVFAPLAGPDFRAADHGIGVNHVRADAQRRAFERKAAAELDLGRLGRAVRAGLVARNQAVLAGDHHDGTARALRLHLPECFPRDQEIAGGEDALVAVPQLERGVFDGGRRRDAGVADKDVDRAEFERRAVKGGNHRGLLRDVAGHAAHMVEAVGGGQFGGNAGQRRLVDVCQHHAGAFRQQPSRDRLANATGAAGDQRHLADHRLGLRGALQLGFLEQPVFDVERLLFGQADVFVDRAGFAHHVDGVDIELAGDAGSRLVARDRHHADARQQHHHRVRVAQRRAAGALAALVIGDVVGAVIGQPALQRSLQRRALEPVIGLRHDHRTNLGAQKMVGTTGAQRGQRLELVRVDEFEHFRRRVQVQQFRAGLRRQAAQHRQQTRQQRAALGVGQRVEARAAEHLHLARRALLFEPRLRALDQADRVVVASLRSLAPAEQAVSAEHDAAQARVCRVVGAELHAELIAGTLPRHPADRALEHLLCDRLGTRRCGDRDQRVRVHVVDMRVGQRRMQRRVDRRGSRVQVEGAMRQVRHHLVFVREAAVQALQCAQLVHVEGGKAVELHRADVAARALDPQHLDLSAGQRIALEDFRRGVAAAVVGDAKV